MEFSLGDNSQTLMFKNKSSKYAFINYREYFQEWRKNIYKLTKLDNIKELFLVLFKYLKLCIIFVLKYVFNSARCAKIEGIINFSLFFYFTI